MNRTSILFILLAACGPVDPEPPTNEEGDPIAFVGPYDAPLGVTRVEPETQTLHPSSDVVITFDRYLSDDEIVDFSAVSMVSGGRRVNGRVEILVSDRALRFRPLDPMIEGLDYDVSLSRDQVLSETGAPLAEVLDLPTYRIDPEGTRLQVDRPARGWDDVKPIFERKCDTCHGDPQWKIVPLEYDDLVGRKSDQVDRFLVRAFDPTDSYLLQKVLPLFANRRFTVQPPPWADAVPLTDDEVRVVEFWIASGAKRE